MTPTDDTRWAARLEEVGADAGRWWASLGEETRSELAGRWRALPLAGSRERRLEVPPVPEPLEPDWNQELYEYVVAHDVKFHLGPRPFHICRAHAAAREALREGRIPATFGCPLDRSDCPMRALIDAAGGSVQLTR